jgi:hypothetical protein
MGSTRWQATQTRYCVEECFSITARVKGRGRSLPVGLSAAWVWKGGGLFVFYEVMEMYGVPCLALDFDRDGRTVKQLVTLSETHPTYGGSRWWFDCPRCFRRVRDLHLPRNSESFACRHCLGLSYESAQATRSGVFYGLCVANARTLGITKGAARRFVRKQVGGYVHEPMLIGDGLVVAQRAGSEKLRKSVHKKGRVLNIQHVKKD